MSLKKVLHYSFVGGLVLLVCLGMVSPVYAQTGIVLDGSFDDWAGQPCIEDEVGDSASDATDIVKYCFVSDQESEITYFLIERVGDTNRPLSAVIQLDIDDNNSYSDAVDREIQVFYNLSQQGSRVDVDVYDGQGNLVQNIASGASWGASGGSGGTQVELGVPFSVLGIVPGFAVSLSMNVASVQGSTIDDGSTEVQWTPADALGEEILIIILIAASLGMAYIAYRKNAQGRSDAQ